MKRLVALVMAGAAGVWLGWRALVRRTGDSQMVWLSRELEEVERRDGLVMGAARIENRGNALGVVRRVEGRLVDGGSGRVLVTRRGSSPPERGWWVSNILQPGESCVAEIDVHPDGDLTGPITLELTVQEMGRRIFQYRTVRLGVPSPEPVLKRRR